VDAPATPGATPQPIGPGQAILASWHQLIDSGALQIAERYLAGTAKTPVARISGKTAAEIGVSDGDVLEVATAHGAIALPVALTDMSDSVVWIPLKSHGSFVHATLGATPGDIVNVRPAAPSAEGNEA
jgi:NADH-quinone oxidoreductase subunit G